MANHHEAYGQLSVHAACDQFLWRSACVCDSFTSSTRASSSPSRRRKSPAWVTPDTSTFRPAASRLKTVSPVYVTDAWFWIQKGASPPPDVLKIFFSQFLPHKQWYNNMWKTTMSLRKVQKTGTIEGTWILPST